MEAKLPDINAGLVTHRKAAMNAYDSKNYTKATISLDAIIALLPEDYKPRINTEEYLQKVSARRLIRCDNCNEDLSRETVEPFEMYLSKEDQLILGCKYMLVWKCPKCENIRPLIGSEKSIKKFQEPFYTGVIYESPRRKGFHDRIGFAQKFADWYRIALREIEYKIGLYRAEYQRQNPDEELIPFEE